jgi:putative spermidine/putrescine transport system ATP-binding protein
LTNIDLSARGLAKSYGRVVAVAGVSFDARAGEIVSLLGPSGCGKTTTLRTIVGLTKPTFGSVTIKGRDVTRLPVHKRNIGMLFQNYALFPYLTVAENLAFGLKLRSKSKVEIAKEVEDALRLVNLAGYSDRRISQLSGGQQQRVALARAIVIRPDLLLLDEPFGALDRKLRERMQIEMKGLQARLGITTILVTHDQEEALTLSDTIVVMNEGRIEQMGAPADIYERPATAFVADFIGVSNLFPGALQKSGAGWKVATDEGIALPVHRVADHLREGARVTVVVRPENVVISPVSEAQGRAAAIEARVEQMVYRGTRTYLYLRRSNGQPLVASCGNDAVAGFKAVAESHGSVAASWDPTASHVISEAS